MAVAIGLAVFFLAGDDAAAAFGVTSSGGYYTVNDGARLVFKIDQSNGDMTSCKYNGVEYQNQSHFSHVESGLGSGASITATTSGNYIIITEHSSTWYRKMVDVHKSALIPGTHPRPARPKSLLAGLWRSPLTVEIIIPSATVSRPARSWSERTQ